MQCRCRKHINDHLRAHIQCLTKKARGAGAHHRLEILFWGMKPVLQIPHIGCGEGKISGTSGTLKGYDLALKMIIGASPIGIWLM